MLCRSFKKALKVFFDQLLFVLDEQGTFFHTVGVGQAGVLSRHRGYFNRYETPRYG
jgi:photosystem II stability/assembly factor-like uncharacterized protein